MTTYSTRPQDPHNLDAGPQERHRTSPVLLGALAVALVALAVWWSTQRDSRTDTATPVAVETAPAPAAPAVVRETQPAGARAPAATRSERARPVPADRAPRPLADNPMPEYPRSTLRNSAEGSVTLAIQVDASGMPVDVQVVQRSGDRDRAFDRAAIEAVRNWRFEPAIRNGKAVSSTVQLPVDFRRG